MIKVWKFWLKHDDWNWRCMVYVMNLNVTWNGLWIWAYEWFNFIWTWFDFKMDIVWKWLWCENEELIMVWNEHGQKWLWCENESWIKMAIDGHEHELCDYGLRGRWLTLSIDWPKSQ